MCCLFIYLLQLYNIFHWTLMKPLWGYVQEHKTHGHDCVVWLLLQFVPKPMSSLAGNAGDAPHILIYKNKREVAGRRRRTGELPWLSTLDLIAHLFRRVCAHMFDPRTLVRRHTPPATLTHPSPHRFPPGGEASLAATQPSSRRSLLARTAPFWRLSN